MAQLLSKNIVPVFRAIGQGRGKPKIASASFRDSQANNLQKLAAKRIDDEPLSDVTPLLRRHINPFGRYHFDLNRMRHDTNRHQSSAP